MTIRSFLELTDVLSPNAVDPTVRMRWLCEIEGRVRVELLGENPSTLPVIDLDTSEDTELAAPPPYDRLYWLHHLAMCNCLAGNVARYENTAALFNETYAGFGRWLKRRDA